MIKEDVKLGVNVKILYPDLVNLYGCQIEEDAFIGPFVEIQRDSKIGKKTRISSHSFICEGVNIGENCFIAHGVNFVNDKFTEERVDWILRNTYVGNNVRIGSNATIMPVNIGDNSIIGAGSVVTHDVPPNSVVVGNPARILKINSKTEESKKIPFLDLKKQYLPIKDEIKREINWVLDNTSFVLGEKVKNFENNFANFCNKKYAVALNTGTSALHLALLAKNIKPGDEVITVPNSFIATAEAISYVGATPVFVDIDSKTYHMDPSKIEEKITEKTKAIIPVHLYGQTADMDKIMEIAKRYNLSVIEDCCQSHGAEYKGKKVPVCGIGCFSFYPGKNLGAYGEGGMVVTDDEDIAKKISVLRDHGQKEKYIHSHIGYNYRMDGIQGAVLNVKLKYLDKWITLRREKAKLYNDLLNGIVEVPLEADYSKGVYHLYIIRVKHRKELMDFLKTKLIDTGLHYPIPIHLQECYKFLGLNRGDFPVTEKYADEILSLPMFPELKNEQIHFVADSIKEFYKQKQI